jgi:hypothetical protein
MVTGSVIFRLGVKTRIWWGEAGIPPNVSVGTDELSRTSAAPSTETWVGVIGNPSFSNEGNSDPSAVSPPSKINAVLERSVRMFSSQLAEWDLPLRKTTATPQSRDKLARSQAGSPRGGKLMKAKQRHPIEVPIASKHTDVVC